MTQVNPQAGQVVPSSVLTDPAERGDVFHPELKTNKISRGRWFREVGWRYIVGAAAIVYALIPVLFILSASLNPTGSVASASILPRAFSIENYARLFTDPAVPFALWARNTLIVAVVVVGVSIFCSALGAYAFSRFQFRGRRGSLFALLLIQMFPQFLAAVALFLMFTRVGEAMPYIGLDTIAGYILVLLGGALGQVWLIKGFFDTIPPELDEAAVMDGATHTQIYFKIILPLVRPILAVTGLLAFIGVIGEFILASIFLRDTEVKTLAVGLWGLLESDKTNNLGIFCAAAVLTAIPVVLLFLYLQKFIVGGITAGSVKG
ncbi:sugar ABC transporter permease [Microbacterium sp.]|uniref:sugar ABC transporter permease n=1 Tax=Microbacterium sp. TaxID=51671 RepID=UPI002E3547EB|nr:sugar ABC transporter permease [Microbacterium sp.]HEX5729928.1 sugar ABC transporter permease [Microbacterium sp.]